MIRAILILALFAITSFAQDQNLGCENSTNTSASPRYRGESNGNLAPGDVSKLALRTLLYSGANTRIYVRYMPWFGDSHHCNVGYRSDDRQQISHQVADMMSRGIQGAIVSWYGPGNDIKNQSTLLLLRESERQGFEFAISENVGAIDFCQKQGCDPNQKLIADMQYAAAHLESSPAYLRFNGRPAVFFFGLEKYHIDWQRLRQALPLNPLFFFRNPGAFSDASADGAYAWVAPEAASGDDPTALKYLERFYSKAQGSGKIAMGSAYKGFDDSDASWGKGRRIDQQCGQTWLASFAEAGKFYSARHQLAALIIPTWNDYEEGTEIETGVDNCANLTASLNHDRLTWSSSGRENTIDHYSILAQNASQWTLAASLPAGTHSVTLSGLQLRDGTSAVCVEAVGKASLLNHFSGPIAYVPAARQ